MGNEKGLWQEMWNIKIKLRVRSEELRVTVIYLAIDLK